MNNTIYDIAKKAGVSPSTVSKVINGYKSIPQETKDRIRKTMEEMHYVPNVSARSLSKRKSRNIGILAHFGMNITPFKHALFTEILDSFMNEVNSKGYDLLFISRNIGSEEGTSLKNIIARDVRGVLLFGDFENQDIKEVIDSNVPKVAFDYPLSKGKSVSGVYSDSYKAMYELTDYAIKNGHRNIVMIHGEDSDITKLRIKGFNDALKDNGVEQTDDMLVEGAYLDIQLNNKLTEQIIKRENRPTCVFYPDDNSAMGAISVYRKYHIHCPRDISICGFDGLPISSTAYPSLMTVKQDSDAIGKTMADELVNLIENPNFENHYLKIDTKLQIGDSLAKLN